MIRWIKRLCFMAVGLVLLLVAPVAYNEALCRGDGVAKPYAPLLEAQHHRSEARSFLTYPEWHIVHAYDDYGAVLRKGDPHDYGYLRGIAGFWTSLCALSKVSDAHGGFDFETKQTIYTIGVSFTAELLMKAAYEETLGRVATWVRGEAPSKLDQLSGDQARAYAKFLQQVPWYRWDFDRDRQALNAVEPMGFRDRERRAALGIEYRIKGAYAGVITKAVEGMTPDALTLRMVVRGLSRAELSTLEGVRVIGDLEDGLEIETPRYRALTHLLAEMAGRGAEFVEIAGNDDILLTATSDQAYDDALFTFGRQGYGDLRHLIVLPVMELAPFLRDMSARGLTLEHIHDY